MKRSQAFVTILLMTTTLHLQASYIAHQQQCPLNATKTCQQLSYNGVVNIKNGWKKIVNTEMSQKQFLSSRPHELGAQKVVHGTAQIAYGYGQIVIGEIGQFAIKHPDKAIITAGTIACWIYIANM
jgi:hypothetical protein